MQAPPRPAEPHTAFPGIARAEVLPVVRRSWCPIFPGAAPIHWGFDDPAEAPEAKQLEAFRRVRDEILRRLQLFINANA